MDPSDKTRGTRWEKWELSSSEDLDLRKESNCFLVGPLDPAVTEDNRTWRDSGEYTMFFPLPSVVSSCLVILSATSVRLLMVFLRYMVKLTD